MSSVSTHVLDTARGRPAAGVRVDLERLGAAAGPVASGSTDADGRLSDLAPDGLPTGTYRLRFDTAAYFAGLGVAALYPEVVIVVEIADDSHHHLPLLLGPYSYSTYRGS